MKHWLAAAGILAWLGALPGFVSVFTSDDASRSDKTTASPPAARPSAAPSSKPSSRRRGIRGVRFFPSFSPPSSVPYSATGYAVRASRVNSTGMTGLASYASPASCPLKANLFSQDVTFTAPVTSLPGRAGLGLSLALAYNSKVWIESGTTMFLDGDKGFPAAGWRLGFGRIDGMYSGPDGYNHYYFTDPSGNVHDLRYNSVDGVYESTDSTYLDFNDSTGVLRDRNGTQTTFALVGGTGGYVLPTQVKDRNGNYTTINYSGTGQQISSIVDTLGRTTSFGYNGDGTLASVSNHAFGGGARSWTFGYSTLSLSYSFASALTVNGPSSGSNITVLSSITYPNGTKTTFAYNGYAQLTEVDLLSSSGAVRAKYLVTWQGTPGGGWAVSPTPSQVGNYDGATTNYWSLSFGTYTTTVTDPLSTQRTTTFVESGGWDDGLPSQTQIGSPLETVANTWGNDGNSINPRITQVLTTLNDTSQQSKVATSYTTYGNPSEVDEYNYGNGAPGALLRKTLTTYVTDSNYTSRHILSLSSSVIVYDGTGTAKSNAAYAFDGASLGSVSGASNHDDSNYGTGMIYRGLVTTDTKYTDPVTPAGPISHSRTYDMLGNLLTATVDCCNQETFSFSSNTQFSQPDSVTRGVTPTTLTTSATYDSSTSLRASSTDENNQATSYTFDTMDRPISTTRPDGTVISTSYDDASASPGVTETTPITSSTSKKVITTSDGLGRKSRVTIEDGSSTIYSKQDTQYDALGRVLQISQPYTGSGASYWTQRQYDVLNRVTKVIPPDGSASSNNMAYSYSGNAVTITDFTGAQRKQIGDALGRVVETDEPDPSNGNSLTLVTTYTVDPAGNTAKIVQGSQTRTFVFDGLGRKTSESTPEAGTVTYSYTSFGQVTQRTDARGVITNYSFDGLNRISQVSYNVGSTGVPATPTVSYTYGTNASQYNDGKLITLTDGLGSEAYSYDQLGRKTQTQKIIYNVTFGTGYTFDLAGDVVTMTYPSGRVLKENYDTVGRLQSIQNNSTLAYYLSNVSYNVSNQPSGYTYGNNVGASFGYTAQRGQPNSVSYTQGSTTLFGLSYSYTQNGGNNGQIVGITDSVDSGRTAAYTFDSLHRLTAASTSGSANYAAWGLTWTYDRYGNRTAQTATAGNPPSNSTPVNSANQVTGIGGSNFSYDANGNLLQDDSYQYTYDAENRLVQVQIKNGGAVQTTNAFDGNGTRCVKVVVGGASPNRTFSIYDGGQLLSEFDDASTATYTSGTTPGQAPSDSVSLLLYQHADQLTTRAATDNFGNVAYQRGNFPYGDMWYDAGGASASVKRKFTTYKYEAELSGSLNYAMAREHTARLGRFHTPDPHQTTRSRNPQSLNRYGYVLGDPINLSDPTGRFATLQEDCAADYWPEYSFGFIYWPDLEQPSEELCEFINNFPPDQLTTSLKCPLRLYLSSVPAKCDGSSKNFSSASIQDPYGKSGQSDRVHKSMAEILDYSDLLITGLDGGDVGDPIPGALKSRNWGADLSWDLPFLVRKVHGDLARLYPYMYITWHVKAVCDENTSADLDAQKTIRVRCH